jgi:hypothetical protein
VASTLEDIELAFQILKRYALPQITDGLQNYTESLNTLAEISKDIQDRLDVYLYVT